MGQVTCRKCGAESSDRSAFCPTCGERLFLDAATQPAPGLAPCKTCRQPVAKRATKCPHCGVSQPTGGITPVGAAILIVAGLLFAAYVWSKVSHPASPGRFSPGFMSAPSELRFREAGKRRSGSRGQFCHITLEVSSTGTTGPTFPKLFALGASGNVVDTSTRGADALAPGQTTLVEFDLMNAGGCENIASWRVQQ